MSNIPHKNDGVERPQRVRQRPRGFYNVRAGSVRVRLARKLSEAGFHTVPEDLHPALGYYRIRGYLDDTLKWEGYALKLKGSERVRLASWSTMTECLREGFTITQDSYDYFVEPKSWCRICSQECHCPWQDNDEHHCRHKESRLDK